MVTAAYVAMILVLVVCSGYACAVLGGHQGRPGRLRCLRRSVGIRVLIAVTLAAICAVHVGRAGRHPARHARYLAARALRRIPGQPGDGEELDPDETDAYIAICRGWKHDSHTERSRT